MSEDTRVDVARPVRRELLWWFSVLCGLLVLAGVLVFLGLRTEVNHSSEEAALATVNSVMLHLRATDVLYENLTAASLRVLKAETLELGTPSLSGDAPLGTNRVPDLRFGGVSMVGRFDLVDRVTALMGGTATLFVKSGTNFLRIATNVEKEDGSRAVETVLDPAGRAIRAVQTGRQFLGVADILGKSYFTAYEPIRSTDGKIIGVWYTGYPIETLDIIRKQIEEVSILDHGFVALLDPRGRVIFKSRQIESGLLADLVGRFEAQPHGTVYHSEGYSVRSEKFDKWGFTILSAVYLSDLNARTLHLARLVLGLIGLVAGIALWVSYRFANHITSALVKVQIHKNKAEQTQRRLSEELAEAASYVCSIFPPPAEKPLRIDWQYLPSTELGGDAFGYHWIDADHFAVYLLDVCGHGVGACLLSVAAINVIRSGALPNTDFRDPGAVLSALNNAFLMEKQNDMYFTLWYGVYHAPSRTLRHASGGHPPALLLQASGNGLAVAARLHSPGLVIGGMEGTAYTSEIFTIPPGAQLFVLCDGCYEIKRPNASIMAFDEFESFMRQHGLRADGLEQLMKWVRAQHGDGPLDDDFSIVRVCF